MPSPIEKVIAMDVQKSIVECTDSRPRTMSVADSILTEFFEAVDKESDLEGLGERLHKLILEQRVVSDTEIRATLFLEES